MSDADPDLDRASRARLADLARSRGIPVGRNTTKQQLREALSNAGRAGSRSDGDPRDAADRRVPASRVEAFRVLAEARARGEIVMMPPTLTGNARRVHVRQTLREDHRHRITDGTAGAGDKFDELAGSLFSFFRGTALLFYRDIAGEDAWMPTVLALGDVHPGNFGVMPSADNVPIFGVNDFDEAYYAPFTWDLKRGAVGFLLAAEEEGGLGRGKRRTVVRRFVRGYLDALTAYAGSGDEADTQMRQDNAPPLIADLLEDAVSVSRAAWLADDYLDEQQRGFRADDELVPVSSRRAEFQRLVDRYVEGNDIVVPPRAGRMRVKDVAERKGQGTASLGLARYYVLIEGPAADGTDDLVLQVKQARRSALAGLAPPSEYQVEGQADRVRQAHRVQLVGGDAFYGSVDLDGLSFTVRERSPYRDDIDLDDLSSGGWKTYAGICGRVLAHTHALSDETGQLDHDIEPEILAAAGPADLFVDDVLRFAEEAAERLRADHEHFRADHALGAFGSIDLVYH